MDLISLSTHIKPKLESLNIPIDLRRLEFSSTSFQYFRIYCNFLYYSGFSPFRFKRSGIHYQFYTSTARKVIHKSCELFCVGIHIIMGIVTLSLGREYNQLTEGVSEEAEIFKYTIILHLCSYHFILVFLIWTKQNVIKCYFEKCQRFTSTKAKENRKVALAFTMCIISILCGILSSRCTLRLAVQIFQNKSESKEAALKEMVGQFKYNFYLQNVSIYAPDVDEPPMTILTIASVLYSGLCLYAHVIVAFFGVLTFLAALSIRQVSVEFWNHLQAHHFNKRSENILQRFYYVNNLVEIINDFTGPAILTVLLSFVPLLASRFANLTHSGDPCEWLSTLVMIIASLVPIVTAADASWRFDKLKDWLLRHEVDEMSYIQKALKLNMVFTHISNQPMGVRGCGLFTITYRFIGSAMSIIVTYSILAFQMHGRSGSVAPS